MKRDRQTEQEKEEESYTASAPGESVVLSAIRERMEEEQEEKRSWRRWLVGTGSLAAAVLLLFRVFFGLAVVEGSSMYPGYEDGDLVFYARQYGELERGDVVLADMQEGRTLIKRVIAVPGEELLIDPETGEVFIDGRELEEPYAVGDTWPGARQKNPQTLGEDEWFLMGDNREHSQDSRYYGTAGRGQIRGKVLWTLRRD